MNAVILDKKEDVLIPLTLNCPKLMLNIMDKPLIYHISDYLYDNGINECKLLEEKDELYPGELYEKISVIRREEDMLTDIKNSGEDILFVTRPMITDMPLKKAFEYHSVKGGITAVYNKGRETGIYIIAKEAFSGNADINRISLNGYYSSLESPEEYISCHRDILKGKLSVKTDCTIKNKGVMIGENTMLKIGALIKPPVYIGKGTVVESGARIEAYSVIGSDCVISSGAYIGGAILNKGCFVGEDAVLKKSLIAPLAKIKNRASLKEFSAVGEASVIGEAAMISEGVSIWNEKYVPDGEKITKNFTTGRKVPVLRFESNKVYGALATGFTPEDAALFGACFSRIYPALKIAVASSFSPVVSMIRYAVISGIQSVGGEVSDIGCTNESVLRFGIDNLNCAGGIYISGDKEISVRLFGKNYTEIRNRDFKRLQNMYSGLKFARAEPKNIIAVSDCSKLTDIYYEKICASFNKRVKDGYVYLKTEEADRKYTDMLCKATGIKLISHKKSGYISGIIKNEGFSLYDESERLLSDKELEWVISLVSDKDEKEMKILSCDSIYAFFRICSYLKDKKTTLKELLVFYEKL